MDCGVGDEGRVGDLLSERVEHLLPVGLEVAVDLVDGLETNSIEKNCFGFGVKNHLRSHFDTVAYLKDSNFEYISQSQAKTEVFFQADF